MSAWYSDFQGGDQVNMFESGMGTSSTPASIGYDDQQQYQQHQQHQQQPAQYQQQAQAQQQYQQQAVSQQLKAKVAAAQQQASASALPGMFQMPTASPPATAETYSDPENSSGYFEQLWQRRRDVAKLGVLALVVLLAMALHSAAWYYLREFIDTQQSLGYWKEVGIRVAYPAIVLVVLWHAKAFLASPKNTEPVS